MDLNKKKKIPVRLAVQIFIFALVGLIAINKAAAETGAGIPFVSDASLHALCPFGGVVTLYNLSTLGIFIQKIHMSSVILMGIIFFMAVLFGPVFCGWICPLGSLQEWTGKIGKKIFKKRYNRFVPGKLDRVLRFARFGVLGWVVYVTAISGTLLFANADPYFALYNFWTGEAALPSIIILVATVAGTLFVGRPWCKYACPYGALLGLFNKFRIFKIKRNAGSCISCGRCNARCPMNIDVAHQEAVTDLQCISCLECTSEKSCPVADTVNLQAGGADVRLNEGAKEEAV
jgi:polyferredoxin